MIPSIRFYSGYEYAMQVDGLLNLINKAIQNYSQFPALIGQTAQQVALLHILTELAFREDSIAYLKYNGDVPLILTEAGFHSSAELGGAVLFPGSLRHPHLASPHLPGQGPFLSVM